MIPYNKTIFAPSMKYSSLITSLNDSSLFRQDNMPFGGVKKSGLGREGIKYAIEEMTNIKTIIISK